MLPTLRHSQLILERLVLLPIQSVCQDSSRWLRAGIFAREWNHRLRYDEGLQYGEAWCFDIALRSCRKWKASLRITLPAMAIVTSNDCISCNDNGMTIYSSTELSIAVG
jgi:hypothetical protein